MTDVFIELTKAPPTPPQAPPTTGEPLVVHVDASAIDAPDDSPLGRALTRCRAERGSPTEVVVSHDSMI